jgi:cell wall-associated NlpC family hydrolase
MTAITPDWAKEYIGVPYVHGGRSMTGADCYGLAYLILLQEFGVHIPELNYGPDEEGRSRLIMEATENESLWTPVSLLDLHPGDVLVFLIKRAPLHLGVSLGGDMMLHTERGSDVCLANITDRRWVRRFSGAFRFHSLEDSHV